MKQINAVISNKKKELNNSYTVNSNKNSLNTVNSNTVDEDIEEVLEKHGISEEGVGTLLAEGLDDIESKEYYCLLVNKHSNSKLLDALHITKEADMEGKIRTKKAVYYQAILRNWGLQTKFKKDDY